MSKIVVGIDGSEDSQQALRWALEQARLRQSALTVVHVTYAGVPASHVGELTRLRSLASERGEETVDKALRKAGAADFGVEIERRVLWEGQPASALLDASQGADLLVVGSRGFGGFRGMLLGSVSQHCVQHARCPVVVVRSGDAKGLAQ